MRSPFRFLLAAGFAVLAACGASGGASPTVTSLDTSELSASARLVADPTGWPADPVIFESVRIVGDTLVAEVSYGGGCARHDFALVFAGVFMESEPVQVRGLLSHNAHGDPCRALLGQTLRYDLGPLRDAYRSAYRRPSGEIVLVGNWPGRLSYRF